MMMIKSPPLPFSSTNKTVVAALNPPNLIVSSSFLLLLNKQKQIIIINPTPNRRLGINNYNHHRTNNKPCCSHSINQTTAAVDLIITTTAEDNNKNEEWRSEVGSTTTIITPPPPSKLGFLFSHHNKASFLLAFFACTTCVAFTSFVIAAVPALLAIGRAAISFSKLADTAREELPSTMAAIRLSSMEISDLTLELSDLSQEITKGVNGSAQVVQAAEAGIRQMGSRAHQQTMSMIEERANLPDLSLQPVVVGAAKKTSRAVGRATKTLMNMISRGDGSPDD